MLKSNEESLVKAINTYAALAAQYTSSIGKLKKEQLEGIVRMKRKQITLYEALYSKSDVNRSRNRVGKCGSFSPTGAEPA